MDEEQIDLKNELIDCPGVLLVLGAIENMNSTNCNEIIQWPASPSEIVSNPSYTNQNSSDATPSHKNEIDILDKNTVGKIKFGQKLKKTFLKTDQGFVLIENAISSSLPECSTVNQSTSEAINKSENVAPHEMSSMNCDTTDIAVHEEKMLTEGPEIQETNNSGIFLKQSDLDEHVTSVHEEKTLETKEHSQLDSKNSKIVFPCCICFKVFPTKNDRKEHSLSSHGTQILENQETPTDCNSSENKENLLCSICSRMFTNKYDLDSHMVNIHQSKILENFKCYICLKVYQTREDINKHFIGDHSLKIQETGTKLNDGENTMNVQETYQKSNRMIKNSLPYFPCHICTKVFQTKFDVNSHIASVHENIKPHKCPDCDKGFRDKTGVKAHVSFVH